MQNNQVEILVLDFGSQYTQLIARRLREVGVYTEIVPYFEKLDSIKAKNPKGIILSGGPASVYEDGAYKPDSQIFNLGIPVLGICYGMQFIAHHFGGSVVRAQAQEFGKATLEISDTRAALFSGVKTESIVWMSHADKVESLPQGFVEIASSGNTKNCAIADFSRQIYALQFHPEVVHSECGTEILKNFAVSICGCKTSWNMKNFAQNEIAKLRKIVLGDSMINLDSNVENVESQKNIESNAKDTQGEFIDFKKASELESKQELIEKLVKIWEDGAKTTHEGLQKTQLDTMRSEIRDSIKEAEHLLLYRENGENLGFIAVDKNVISMLFVAPFAFGRGVGAALVKAACEKYFKDYEILSVGSLEYSLGFYEKLGFKKSGKILNGQPKLIDLSAEKSVVVRNLALIESKAKCENAENAEMQSEVSKEKAESNAESAIYHAKPTQNKDSKENAECGRENSKILDEKIAFKCGLQGNGLESSAEGFCDDFKGCVDFGARSLLNINDEATKSNSLKSAQKPTPKAEFSKVLCAVSGGVDSSVVATLLYRAIGENLIPVFVDTGLLRLGEREAVEKMFRENLKVPLIVVDASELFLSRLKGVVEPEKKRKIIGESFIEVFEKEAKKHNKNGEIKFLAQGTLYPDVIESVSVKGPSKTIKSHHNVGGLPEWMKFELIEPLRELFKDEVRALGRELGMPESMLMRHPFPGPGLAIRILGEVNKADLDLLRAADSIFIESLQKEGHYNSVWQAFCVLLNVKSVGVMGDNRTYDNTICLRAVNALDGMTASFSHLPHEFLESVSNRIINEVKGINRVVYDITSKPPGTIEWE